MLEQHIGHIPATTDKLLQSTVFLPHFQVRLNPFVYALDKS